LQNGRISFGQAAFSGLGGYAFGILVALGLVGPELAFLIALLLPTLMAFLLGLVIARVSGVAHAMLTLAVGQAFYEVAFRWRELAKGDDGMSFALERGEIRGLIGPNGAGKSTLIDVLSGRASNRRGRVMLNGEDVSKLSLQQRRKRGMARSFQRTNIFAELTVEQQLRVASWAVADADIVEVMTELNLAALADRPAGAISYGDQRRLDLALALVGRPQVLLLDEPAAGLTMEESLALACALCDLVNRWNVTVLLVEHDMQVVFAICDRLTVLHLGRFLSEGTCAEIRADPTVVAAYLGTQA